MKKPLFQTLIPSVFFAILFFVFSAIPFFLPQVTSAPLWHGYRVLAVDYAVSDTANALLQDASIDGLVSWDCQTYATQTMDGCEYRSPDEMPGRYYRSLRNWFFDDVTRKQLFYVPFPDDSNIGEIRKSVQYIEHLLLPIAGSYVLESPVMGGSFVYVVLFILFAGILSFRLRRPILLLFAIPFLCVVSSFQHLSVFISVIMGFLFVLVFYYCAWNDGFSPFSKKICIATAKKPFVVCLFVIAIVFPWISKAIYGCAVLFAFFAVFASALLCFSLRYYRNSSRLHPRLNLAALMPVNTVNIYVFLNICAVIALLSAVVVYLCSSEMMTACDIPATVPVQNPVENGTADFSLAALLEAIVREENVNPDVYVPSFADYAASRWFEKMYPYIPVERIAEFEQKNSFFAPVPLIISHFSVSDTAITSSAEIRQPDEVIASILCEPLPPLEYMQARSGMFLPVKYLNNNEGRSLSRNTSQSNTFSLMFCAILIILNAISFFKLYRYDGRQNHVFYVLLPVRSDK